MTTFDGNAEQVRSIIHQAVESTLLQRTGIHEDIEGLKASLDTQITVKVDAAITKMKFWLVSAVLTQILAMLPVIFFLGGIYSTNNAALEILKTHQVELAQRSLWMRERERVEQALETWAKPKGYEPPQFRDDVR